MIKQKFLINLKNYNFFLILLFIIALTVFQNKVIAMWFGVLCAMLSAVSNDSVQTLGTFISSNKKISWWKLWMFIGGIFVFVMLYGWYSYDGAIHFDRLTTIPEVESFRLIHILAPIVLLALTHYRVPVSTTFLLLSVFSDHATIEKMLTKTFIGYIVAFLAAILVWYVVVKFTKNYFTKKLTKQQEFRWKLLQWGSTAFLWSSWLVQDIANIAVFLPRKISFIELTIFTSIGFTFLGIILYNRGGAIQKIVEEKSDVIEVRAATLIDFVYALILVLFKNINNFPMSTTWVFLGLLAGREFILIYLGNMQGSELKGYQNTLVMILKDVMSASIGVIVSILLVVLIRTTMW